jgi:hypothetical protein
MAAGLIGLRQSGAPAHSAYASSSGVRRAKPYPKGFVWSGCTGASIEVIDPARDVVRVAREYLAFLYRHAFWSVVTYAQARLLGATQPSLSLAIPAASPS